jgi:hypothetical protein
VKVVTSVGGALVPGSTKALCGPPVIIGKAGSENFLVHLEGTLSSRICPWQLGGDILKREMHCGPPPPFSLIHSK